LAQAFESIPSIPRVIPGSESNRGNRDGGISTDFEDIGRFEEQKSINYNNTQTSPAVVHNVGIGGDEAIHTLVNAESSTDQVNQLNFGTNTQNIMTDEKQLNAVVDTKDIGSQIIKDVERHNATVPFKLRAKEANSKLSLFHKKLTAKFYAQTKKRNLSQMRRALSVSNAMALK
jgi:hypothetical protein